MCEIIYLPLAVSDLNNIIDYIFSALSSPLAASKLLVSFEKSISKLADSPYRFRVYSSKYLLENDYRLLAVNNYAAFYVVKNDLVEIHRIVYAKLNLNKIFEK